jgi:predicted TIM-barrel fold metal-dependent hydrolase
MNLPSLKRRDWLKSLSVARLGLAPRAASAQDLPLTQFEPRSALRVKQTKVLRSRYPLIDFHTHITMSGGLNGPDRITFAAQPAELLPSMDHKNIRIMVNLTGGYGNGLREAIRVLETPHPDRFLVFTEPTWNKAALPDYPKFQADQIEIAHRDGAHGLKVLKTLGLYLREQITEGKLVKVDDPRFDPMWEAVGANRMPVAIHTSDPVAFFQPIDRFNERWEELHNHPDWSFYGKDFPSDRELQEARRRVMRRHPRTNFVCLHCAESEDLEYVSECLASHPNMYVDIAARIGELGRQPRAARKFFDQYQDRIVFGTDAIPKATNFPQQVFEESLYEIYYRFLETDDEYFDYSTAKVPPQGRWRISGLGLSDSVLHKVYWQNAARLLNLSR